MCGRATLRIVLSTPCMMFASMIEIVIMPRLGTGEYGSPLTAPVSPRTPLQLSPPHRRASRGTLFPWSGEGLTVNVPTKFRRRPATAPADRAPILCRRRRAPDMAQNRFYAQFAGRANADAANLSCQALSSTRGAALAVAIIAAWTRRFVGAGMSDSGGEADDARHICGARDLARGQRGRGAIAAGDRS